LAVPDSAGRKQVIKDLVVLAQPKVPQVYFDGSDLVQSATGQYGHSKGSAISDLARFNVELAMGRPCAAGVRPRSYCGLSGSRQLADGILIWFPARPRLAGKQGKATFHRE